MQAKLSVVALSVVAAFALSACGEKEAPPVAAPAAPAAPVAKPEVVVKLGHVAPLTGPQAHLGKDNENAARMAESYAALYLLLGTLLAIMPGVCLTIVLVKFVTSEVRKGYYKASHAIEDRVEENKRKHYIAGGI